MNICVITQKDYFVIPENINKIIKLKDINICSIITVKHKGSLQNKQYHLAKGFGILQAFKMALTILKANIDNNLDKIFKYKLYKIKRSCRAVACRNKIKYINTEDIHSQSNINYLKSLKLDLIVSYSAPCVFKDIILKIPTKGCINLHCSLLPRYPGLLPSFWTIYNSEDFIGATVHYMSTKIDNGEILGQVKIKRNNINKMFDIIRITKKLGGELMCEVITKLYEDNIITRKNNVNSEDYFTWPTIKEIREFRRKGGKLI